MKILPNRAAGIVLAVDDEPRILSSIARLLQPHYQVLVTSDGVEALQLLRKNRVQVLISDQRMPGMTGVELLSQARKISPNTSRILLTGYADLEAIESAVNSGEVFRYLCKPWKNDELLSTVAQASLIAEQLLASNGSGNISRDGLGSLAAVAGSSVLVLDESAQFGPMVERLLGERVKVLAAVDASTAARLLQTESVEVILANLGHTQRATELAFLKSVKAANASIQSLVIAPAHDARLMVALINEGQVYRFAVHPLREGTLKLYLLSAIHYHRKLLAHPMLAIRHQVQPISDPQERQSSRGFRDLARSFTRLFAFLR